MMTREPTSGQLKSTLSRCGYCTSWSLIMEREQGDMELMKLQAREMSRVMQEVSDLEFAYLLQLEEALRISAMYSGTGPLLLTSSGEATEPGLLSEDRQVGLLEQTREVEKLNQELDDSSFAAEEQARFLEIDAIVEHDAKFARSLAFAPEREWDRSGMHLSDPFVGDRDMGSLTERLKRLLARELRDAEEDFVAGQLRRRGKEPVVANSVWEPMVLSKVFFVTAEEESYVAGPSFWPAERQLKELTLAAAEASTSSCVIEEVDSCNICLEFKVVSPDTFLTLHRCGHEFCTDCLHKYAEAQAKSGVVEITCPQHKCREALTDYECTRLLDADSFEAFRVRQVEAAIPEEDRSYCPFQDCSALCLKPLFDSSTLPSSPLACRPDLPRISRFAIRGDVHGGYEVAHSCQAEKMATLLQVPAHGRACCWLLPHELQVWCSFLLSLWKGVGKSLTHLCQLSHGPNLKQEARVYLELLRLTQQIGIIFD